MPITERVATDLPVTIKTSTYTLLPSDWGREIQFQNASAVSANLPAVADAGNGYNVVIRNIGTATLTIDPAGSEQIDGGSTVSLSAGDSLWIRSDGTEWKSIASGGAGGTGTVTQVDTSGGLAGGPITSTGTVSIADGGVSTAKLADNGVTSAKIAAANLKDIGDLILSQGDLLYYDGTGVANLGAGTNGQVLTLASGLPAWANASVGGLVVLGSSTASSSASIESPTLSSAYKTIMIVGSNIVPTTDDVQMQMLVSDDDGTSYKSSGYQYAITGWKSSNSGTTTASSSANAIGLNYSGGEGVGNASTEGIGFTLYLDAFGETTNYKRCRWQVDFVNAEGTPKLVSANGAGLWNGGTSAIDKVKFQFSSGNMVSGTFDFFGLSG